MLSLLHKVLSYKFIRFLIAGGTSAVVHIGIVFIATHIFSVWYLFATIIGFLCAVGINFTMQKFFTFRDTQAKAVHIQSFLFFLVSSINLIVNSALMIFFVEYAGLQPVIAQISTSALIAIWSYLIYKKLFHVETCTTD